LNIPHLTNDQKSQVCTLLSNHKSLFQGKLGLWDTTPVPLELEECAKPYDAKAYPIPHIHEETVQKEVDWLCRKGVLTKETLILSGQRLHLLYLRKKEQYVL
jgi:hypothetical protein